MFSGDIYPLKKKKISYSLYRKCKFYIKVDLWQMSNRKKSLDLACCITFMNNFDW